ncbi:endogenous retrovirus group PABLB member 1 Env polyprotein-like [Chiloscyllium punctatum]|uniref:endogenous retrovirus group PABLB member 1 Env polyprotein-like n=1 Tax=Chiloscyllium punctatum TaxID=137246 RepID=UPI003B641CF2
MGKVYCKKSELGQLLCMCLRSASVPGGFLSTRVEARQEGHEMYEMYQDETAWNDRNCTSLSLMFPPSEKKDSKAPPYVFSRSQKSTSCVRRRVTNQSRDLGELKLCTEIKDVTETDKGGNYSALKVPQADLWWYCGGKILRPTLPPDWRGMCAIVQLAIPFTRAFEKEKIVGKKGRSKRSLLDTSFDDRIYLDSVGVPKGVPDEFKARNQITAGFESALFWWVTINKNVDWINYTFYNQQRFINYTRDAVKGISDQLDATSRMAWENRMALDMILVEKGCVCVMLGGSCCTFIPNNTAPDGSITRALRGLTTFVEELAENSGVDTSLTGWLESWFGNGRGWWFLSLFP